MIRVDVDMTAATPHQVEDFLALPSVSAALDCLAVHGRDFGIRLYVHQQPQMPVVAAPIGRSNDYR